MSDEDVRGALVRIQSELAILLDTADAIDEPHLAALLSEAKWCVEKIIDSKV